MIYQSLCSLELVVYCALHEDTLNKENPKKMVDSNVYPPTGFHRQVRMILSNIEEILVCSF